MSHSLCAAVVVCMNTMNHLPLCEKVTQHKDGVILQQRHDFSLKSLFQTQTSCERLTGDLFNEIGNLYKEGWLFPQCTEGKFLNLKTVQSQIRIYVTVKGNSEISFYIKT